MRIENILKKIKLDVESRNKNFEMFWRYDDSNGALISISLRYDHAIWKTNDLVSKSFIIRPSCIFRDRSYRTKELKILRDTISKIVDLINYNLNSYKAVETDELRFVSR